MPKTTKSTFLLSLWLFLVVNLFLWIEVKSGQPGGSRYIAIEANGYENVTVAIHPSVPPSERSQVIENLKRLLTETSKQLFYSTKQKAYLKQVYFLVPQDWTEITASEVATFQSFLQPDIIVAPSNPIRGNSPYALQSARCGHVGHYVHLTPEFVNQNSGNQIKNAKNVVKSWAQYRYGVFEECGILKDVSHPPLYWKGSELALTSCAANSLTGSLNENCDPVRDLSEGSCKFVLNPDQSSANPSIMFSADLTDSSQNFCDDTNHNIDSPNMQNTLCNQKSTWSVIETSRDIKSANGDANLDTTPNFVTVKSTVNKFMFLIENSTYIKSNERSDNIFLSFTKLVNHHIPDGTEFGLVVFDGTAHRLQDISALNKDSKDLVTKSLIISTPKDDNKYVNIRAAILEGIRAIEKDETTKGKGGQNTIVLVTGGIEDNQDLDPTVVKDLSAEMSLFHIKLNVILYFDQINENDRKNNVLQELTTFTGGQFYVFGVIPSPDPISEISHEILDSIMRESVEIDEPLKAPVQIYQKTLRAEESVSEGWFYVDESIKHNMSFFITYNDRKHLEGVVVTDPSKKIYDIQNATYKIDEAERHINLDFPDVPTGNWTYKVKWLAEKHIAVVRVIAIPDTEQIRVKCWVKLYNHDSSDNQVIGGKTPVVFYAKVMRGQTPIINANVQASILMPSEDGTKRKRITLNLTDDGSGDPDIKKSDGIYSRYFTTFTKPGYYSFWVNANDNNGKANILLPGSSTSISNDLGICAINPVSIKSTGPFHRRASGESFYVSSVEATSSYSPSRISDLTVTEFKGDTVHLKWTAVGNDYDTGTVQKYEIRSSKSRDQMTEKNFLNANLLVAEFQEIVKAKEQQTATFKLEERKVSYYIAARAYNGRSYGPISNVITVIRQGRDIVYPVTVTPTLNATTTTAQTHTTAGLTTGAIVAIAIAAIAMLAIVGVVCFVTRRKQKSKTARKSRSVNRDRDYGKDPNKIKEAEMLSMRNDEQENNS